MVRSLGLGLIALAACGCTRMGYLATGHPEPWWWDDVPHEQNIQVVNVNVASPTSARVPREPATPQEDRAPSFNAVAAKSALEAADLSDCKPENATARYGHAKVTFAPTGAVKRVVIDSPTGLPDDAVQCAGKELASVSVPAFAGSELTMGTGWSW